jgi:hypothetical protein
MAIIPETDVKTKHCRLLLADGTLHQDKRQVKAVVTSLARFFAVDLVALRQRCSEVVRAKNYLPLPLSPELILVPLALSPVPPPTGYVNLNYVTGMEKNGDKGKVILAGDHELICYQSFQSLRTRFLAAKAALAVNLFSSPGISGQKLELIRVILTGE